MPKFIQVSTDSPCDVELINLDAIVAVAKAGAKTKLFMPGLIVVVNENYDDFIALLGKF